MSIQAHPWFHGLFMWANTLLEFFDALTHSLDTHTPFHDQTPGVRESNLTEKIYLHWDWDE